MGIRRLQEEEQTRGGSLGTANQNVFGWLETSGLRWKLRLKRKRGEHSW